MIDRSKQEITREKSVFQPIVENISRTVDLPASIWVPDEQRQVLTIAASVRLPARYAREAFLDLDEPSVTGEAFKTEKVLRVPDVLADQRWKYKDMARKMGWKSALCVPIQVNKTCIGVVSIYTFVVREFSDLEIGLLTHYADQIRLTLEADRRRETFSRLLKAGHQIEQLITEQPQVVLEEIVKAACQVIGADCAVLYPYDPQREDFYDIDSVAVYGLSKPLQLSQRPRRQTGMAAYVKREREVVISDIEREDPRMLASPFIQREGIKAFMGIALQVAAEVLGILYVDFRVAHPFSDEEKDTIRLFAHQAALAIHNMRSFQQAENRAEALKRLHEIGPALVSISGMPESLQTVLSQIAQNAKSVLSADLVDFYEYVQSRDEYILPPVQVGERYEQLPSPTRIHEDDVVRAIVKGRQSQYFREVQQEPTLTQPFSAERPDAPPVRFVIREKIRSTAAIPLIVRTEVVGVLFVNYRSPQTFPQQQRELIELFASQAAIVIHNFRLFQDIQHRVRDLEIVSDVVQVMSTKLDTKELLEAIVSRISDELHCTHCTLFFPQEEQDGLLLVPQVTHGGRAQVMSRRFKPGEGLAGWVFQHGVSLALADAKADPRFADAREKQDQPRSMLVAPIKVGDRTIGVISADQDKFAWFSENDRRLVDALAWQAGIAIERATGLALLQDISNQIIGAQKVDDVLRQIVSGAIQLTNTKAGIIYLFSEDRESITQSFAYSPTFDHPKPRMSGEGGITRRVIETGEMMVFPDISKDDRVNPALADRGVRAMIAIPLRLGQEVIGVLYLNNMEPRNFTETERALLTMLASQAAIAIQNARLYEQRIKDMIVLQKINTAVTTGEWTEIGTLAKVLHLIVESLIDVFQGVSCAIRLHDPVTGQFGARIASGALQERVRFSPRAGGASQQILRTKEAIYAQDPSVLLLNGQPVIRTEIQKEGIQAVAYLPLLSEENVIGILYVEWDVPRRFFQNEKRILELFAGQAAVSIKNARLFDELGVRAKQLVRLQKVTSIISAEPADPAKVLHMIVESIDDVFEGASCEITLYNPRTKEFTERNAGGVLEEEVRYLPRLDGTSEHVIQTRKPFYAENALAALPSGQPAIRERIKEKGIEAVANLPLVGKRDVIGVLYVGWTEPRHFSDNDKQILELFAHQAVIAMENARLFEQIQTLSQLGADLATLDREV